MNDKATSVLEQYDMTINRTFKGRGTIICDTEKGMRVLKEYKGKNRKARTIATAPKQARRQSKDRYLDSK